MARFRFLIALTSVTFFFSSVAIALAGPPNVLFIVADDQRFDTIAALGNDQIQTPTLDALVARGFVFHNAYCQGGNSPAVCVPSRVQILSGRSTFRAPDPRDMSYDGPTLGGVFRAAGYNTLCVSKPGNSFPAAHAQFETVVHIPHVGAQTNQRCADAVLDFLAADDGQRPCFIYYAPSMPHDPRTAEPQFHALYDPAQMRLSPNFMPEQSLDIGVLGIRDEKLAAYPRDPAEMRQHVADYYACITSLDYHLGRILTVLQEQGRLQDTLVVFTSDQGLAVGGRHGLMGKQNLYEHFKSPLVLAGPGVPCGESAALVYLFDLFPTFCDLCDLPIPAECDGASLRPVLHGQATEVRESLFAVYCDSQRMVRDARWKLLWYPPLGRYQLFDLQHDPDELHNLVDDESAKAQLAALQELMAAEQARWGDPLHE